jgi:hypothetical protein
MYGETVKKKILLQRRRKADWSYVTSLFGYAARISGEVLQVFLRSKKKIEVEMFFSGTDR